MNTPKHPEEQAPMENESDAVAPAGPQSIRQLRLRLGLTQEEFAHAIAVTVSTVNRWENGHASPSKLAWRAIQSLLKKRSAIGRERQPG
jgi:DNA-binding transcriptional regulator YiaG